MAVDNAFYQIGSWGKPDFIRIDCQNCHHTFYYNEDKIPSGERYEIICPKCKSFLMRRKG